MDVPQFDFKVELDGLENMSCLSGQASYIILICSSKSTAQDYMEDRCFNKLQDFHVDD